MMQVLSKDRRKALSNLNLRCPHINGILVSLTPDHSPLTATNVAQHRAAIPAVERAVRLLGATARMAQVASAPDPAPTEAEIMSEVSGVEYLDLGKNPISPVLPIDVLDPVVFHAAIDHWHAGHYRNAVGDAAIAVNRFAQQCVSRTDISDRDLMSHAFSEDDPKPGEKRLRCPGNPKTESVRSQQQGAKLFAMGSYAAFRNPANHLSGDWNPVTAFQHLAAFSLIAGWVRNWRVEPYVAPISSLAMPLASPQKPASTACKIQKI
jgi:hypothetical protein